MGLRTKLSLVVSIGILFLAATSSISTSTSTGFNSDDILYYSVRQYTKLSLNLNGKNGFIHTGKPQSPDWTMTELGAWTVGFYGGSLWMLYKLTQDHYWKELALEYQERVKPRQFDRGTHDVGFVIMSTYGLAMEHGGIDDGMRREYELIIIQTAISLSSRFHRPSGCIRSWDRNDPLVLVIIDNMMNLELLFKAYELTGDQTFYDVATSHANRTMQEHFRPNGGTFHVVGYNETTGDPERKFNHQGLADNSTWSRGLAWAIHGYTTSYQKTGNQAYLDTAEKAARYFIERLPSDLVPHWDFDAPLDQGQYQPRDSSAGAIAAHAFLNLFEATGNRTYFDLGEGVLAGLEGYRADAKPEYQIPAVLVNGTVFYHEKNSDTAIVYGDFYYLRAIDLHKEISERLQY